jgi:hypothetical protein
MAPRSPGPKRPQNEPFYIKEFNSETHRPKSKNASFRKRASSASGKEAEARKHFDGFHHIGIYPLLQDNTSWFLAADFDKANWHSEAVTFLDACKAKEIPAYLERSRSGNGGHVWIFFDNPYPAVRSRKIFISILEQSGAFSMFDQSSSFDRLFPNQDFLSGKGFGNLIALPLFKPTFEKGNGCFVNPASFEPFTDQWDFLKNIQKVSIDYLDEQYKTLSPDAPIITPQTKNGKLKISLNNTIKISRNGLSPMLIHFLKEELNFANSEFFIKKKSFKINFRTQKK